VLNVVNWKYGITGFIIFLKIYSRVEQGAKSTNLEIRCILSRKLYTTLFVVFRFDLTGRSIDRIIVAKISPDGAVLLATGEHTN
jgi:hypothetical protein